MALDLDALEEKVRDKGFMPVRESLALIKRVRQLDGALRETREALSEIGDLAVNDSRSPERRMPAIRSSVDWALGKIDAALAPERAP